MKNRNRTKVELVAGMWKTGWRSARVAAYQHVSCVVRPAGRKGGSFKSSRFGRENVSGNLFREVSEHTQGDKRFLRDF